MTYIGGYGVDERVLSRVESATNGTDMRTGIALVVSGVATIGFAVSTGLWFVYVLGAFALCGAAFNYRVMKKYRGIRDSLVRAGRIAELPSGESDSDYELRYRCKFFDVAWNRLSAEDQSEHAALRNEVVWINIQANKTGWDKEAYRQIAARTLAVEQLVAGAIELEKASSAHAQLDESAIKYARESAAIRFDVAKSLTDGAS